jgi:hypothetical protein
MGVISALIAADAGMCDSIARDLLPPANWPSLDADGLNPLTLSTLHFAASGRVPGKIRVVLCSMRFRFAGGDKEHGPWLVWVPKSIHSTFAAIEPSNALAIAKKWVATDELQRDGWSAESAEEFVHQLAVFALQAKQQKQRLFLWVSL